MTQVVHNDGDKLTGAQASAKVVPPVLATEMSTTDTFKIKNHDKGGQVFNVIAYGADATGATNTQSAVASALTAAEAVNGIVYFPPGTYRMDTGVTVTAKKWIRFVGSGEKSTIIDYRGTGYAFYFNQPMAADGSGGPPFGCQAEVSGMEIKGTSSGAGAIKLRDGIGSHFKRLYIRDFSAGVGILLECWDLFCESCTVEDVWFDNCLYGVRTSGSSESGGSGGHNSFDQFFAHRVYGREFVASGHLFHLHGGFNKSKFDGITFWPHATNANQRLAHWVNTGTPTETGTHTWINPQIDGTAVGFILMDFNDLGGLVTIINPYTGAYGFLENHETLSLMIVRPGQTRSLWIPAHEFISIEGTPVWNTYASVSGDAWNKAFGWELPEAATAGIIAATQLPQDAAVNKAITVLIHWGPAGGAYGNVRFKAAVKYLTAGAIDPADAWRGTAEDIVYVTQAAPNPYPYLETIATLPCANTARVGPRNPLRVYVGRLPADAADTHTGGVVIFGVEIQYTSAGDRIS